MKILQGKYSKKGVMMVSKATYEQESVLEYAIKRGWLTKDGDIFDSMELRAQVASGDYFITLATQLDKIREKIKLTFPDDAEKLDDLITDLLFLQRHYGIQRTE